MTKVTKRVPTARDIVIVWCGKDSYQEKVRIQKGSCQDMASAISSNNHTGVGADHAQLFTNSLRGDFNSK